MERHIAKRLGIPCAVISAPVHVQDFPARYSPQMGFEGANVMFDTWVHPLMMGLEEHLLTMFRDDFEFHDDAAALASRRSEPHGASRAADAASPQQPATQRRLERRRREASCAKSRSSCAARRGATPSASPASRASRTITLETLYDAKAHFGR